MYIKTSQNQLIAYDTTGPIGGIPSIFIHGGPGSECTESSKIFFDAEIWRTIYFDQRGCGASKPRGTIEHNDLLNTISDMEMLRKKFRIKKWLLFGGSWGSTVALKYAIENPNKVLALVLRGIFLGSKEEIDSFIYGLQDRLPKEWKNLCSISLGKNDILGSYCNAIFSADKKLQILAAKKWQEFESAAMMLTEKKESSSSPYKPTKKMEEKLVDRMRVHLHFLRNECFLKKNEILDKVFLLKNIPTVIVQGQQDPICPPKTAEKLVEYMPWAQIRRIENAGHSAYDKRIKKSLIQTLKQFSKEFKHESSIKN